MASNSTIDRRILKAFYTQYVAVLLIILVFSVGMVSHGRNESNAALVLTGRGTSQIDKSNRRQIGVIQYGDIFTSEQSSELSPGGKIDTVLETLKNHDLCATFIVPVDLEGDDLVRTSALALARSKSINDKLVASGITKEAFKVTLIPSNSQSSEVTVVFEALESRHAA
jgi:hypothetical protein